MNCVVDASVAVKWFVDGRWALAETDVDRAVELLLASRRGDLGFVQPPHFMAEVAAVLARNKPRQVIEDLRDLMNLEMTCVDTAACYSRAVELAIALDHHVFDTLYHAVALESEGAVLVTADRRYFDKAARLGAIAWLPAFTIDRQ
ncbi:MAG TPA: type II toxin-antitoxin system VapC family toxin [Burkholderiaceae bacterium]|nr:type II toxin-antitoxin system VapC family toxin [Burkholderiaceae bacterium]